MTELMGKRLLDERLSETMLHRLELGGQHPLIGLRKLARTLGTEQQLRPEGRHGKHRRAV
jgi:hypothetical protein